MVTYEEHCNTNDTSRQQRDRAGRQAETKEDLWGVVKDSVDTGPLLEEHGDSSANNSLEHGHCLEAIRLLAGDLLHIVRRNSQRSDGNELKLDSIPSSLFLKVRKVLLNHSLFEH